MSLSVTQRPYQTINGELSKWNAVGNPVLYKMQRKDFTFASVTNSGGFVQLVLDSTFGDVSASFVVGNSVYFQTDAGVYAVYGTVSASSYGAPNNVPLFWVTSLVNDPAVFPEAFMPLAVISSR